MATQAVSIDLGDMADHAQRHLREGDYASLDEVMREAVRALNREKAAFDAMLRRKVGEALDDPRPSIPADDMWAELDRRAHQRRA